MPINAGELYWSITIQTAPTSQSDSGEVIFDWEHATEQQVKASWLPGGTKEQFQAQQRLGSYVEGVYKIRDLAPRPTPDASRILGHDRRIYDVKPWIETSGRYVGLLIPVVARGE